MLLVTLLVWLQTATTAPALSAQSVEASRLNRDTSAATLRPMGDSGRSQSAGPRRLRSGIPVRPSGRPFAQPQEPPDDSGSSPLLVLFGALIGGAAAVELMARSGFEFLDFRIMLLGAVLGGILFSFL